MIVFLILIISVSILTLRMILPYLLAVIMGAILASVSQPVYRKLTARRFKPKLAAAIVTLGVLFLIVGPISLFATKAIQQGISVGQSLADGGFSFRDLLGRVSGWKPVQTLIGSPEAFEAQVHNWIQGAGSKGTAAVLGIAAQLPKLLLQLALASISFFFFLVDGSRFRRWVANKIPLDADVRAKLSESFKNTAASVIWATLAAASAQAAVIWVGYLVLGIPASFLAAGATFIFAWIPILGSTPVWVAGALYLYLKGSLVKTIVMIVIGLVAGVIDNFVRPIVLKGRGEMHPLVSLVAIFGGISIFGIVGVFVGPILAAILISLLQIWPAVGGRFGLLPGPSLVAQDAPGTPPGAGPRKAS